jgi:hypothetical protein
MRAASLPKLTTVLVALSFATVARAQQRNQPAADAPAVTLTMVGIVAVQPADSTYVSPGGSPYLDRGLGGISVGAGAGVSGFVRRIVITGEISAASITKTQVGRLVGGTKAANLRDAVMAAMVGGANASRSVVFQCGLATIIERHTLDDVPAADDGWLFAPIGGFDAAWSIHPRAAFVTNVRYAWLHRDNAARLQGLGSHLIRAGVGVRLRLGGSR